MIFYTPRGQKRSCRWSWECPLSPAITSPSSQIPHGGEGQWRGLKLSIRPSCAGGSKTDQIQRQAPVFDGNQKSAARLTTSRASLREWRPRSNRPDSKVHVALRACVRLRRCDPPPASDMCLQCKSMKLQLARHFQTLLCCNHSKNPPPLKTESVSANGVTSVDRFRFVREFTVNSLVWLKVESCRVGKRPPGVRCTSRRSRAAVCSCRDRRQRCIHFGFQLLNDDGLLGFGV